MSERLRDRSVRSPLRVSITEVCMCGARAPEVLSARSELSLSKAPSSGVECCSCGAEESRLSEEDTDAEDEDSEELLPPNPESPPLGCCAVRVFPASGCKAEFSAMSVDVLFLVGNHCPELSLPPMVGTDLNAVSVRGMALPFPASELLAS